MYLEEQKLPKGYWTLDTLHQEALKYQTKNDFAKKSPSAYGRARKLNLLDKITTHMIPHKRESKYTEDEIRYRAKQFNTPAEFFKNDLAAYTAAQRFNILDDVMSHMLKKRKLTPDLIRTIAKKYNTRREFELGDIGAYQKAYKLGIFDDVTSHMEKQFRGLTYNDAKKIADKYDNLKKFKEEQPKTSGAIYRNKWQELMNHMERGFKLWSDEMILQSALKYGSRSEWQKKEGSAYNAARKRNIFDKATSHMRYLGNLYHRAVYVWEFDDNSVYVGLTLDLDRRGKEHTDLSNNTQVSKHIQETGILPKFKLISDDYISSEDAQNLENCTIDEYKLKGWKILNVAKAGGLGGCKRRITKDMVIKDALKYKTKTEWQKKSPSIYGAAYRNKWFDEATSHMKHGGTKWNEQQILDDIEKNNYKTILDFRTGSPQAYDALRNQTPQFREYIHSILIKVKPGPK